jgi:hypothetical protein
MAMLIPRLLVAGLSFMAVAWAADDAHASFVCEVTLNTGGDGGDFGAISLQITSNANCGGTNQGTLLLCSQGATSRLCTSATSSHFNESGLAAVFQSLQRAAAADQFVTLSIGNCLGGGSGCASNVTFRSN